MCLGVAEYQTNNHLSLMCGKRIGRYVACIVGLCALCQDKFVDIESSLQVVQAARKQLEEEEGECQKENLDVQLQLEKLENIFKQTKAKLNHWKKEVGLCHV